MYNTIVIPVDIAHREEAVGMFEVAKKLGNDNAKFIVANVVEEIPSYVAAELPKGMLATSKERSRESLAELAKANGIEAEIVVKIGHPANSILEIAEDLKADCIIVASHRPGFKDYLLGSTAARVVRHAQCAVHVMR